MNLYERSRDVGRAVDSLMGDTASGRLGDAKGVKESFQMLTGAKIAVESVTLLEIVIDAKEMAAQTGMEGLREVY